MYILATGLESDLSSEVPGCTKESKITEANNGTDYCSSEGQDKSVTKKKSREGVHLKPGLRQSVVLRLKK